jgi:hypothetical protein
VHNRVGLAPNLLDADRLAFAPDDSRYSAHKSISKTKRTARLRPLNVPYCSPAIWVDFLVTS